jgi:hypothetical protein
MTSARYAVLRTLLLGTSCLSLAVALAVPIAQLSDNEGDTPNTSDSATVIVADSLDGSTEAAITWQILGGYLTQIIPAAGGLSVHGIRSVDQDFSSWGNEALWQ